MLSWKHSRRAAPAGLRSRSVARLPSSRARLAFHRCAPGAELRPSLQLICRDSSCSSSPVTTAPLCLLGHGNLDHWRWLLTLSFFRHCYAVAGLCPCQFARSRSCAVVEVPVGVNHGHESNGGARCFKHDPVYVAVSFHEHSPELRC